MRFAIVALGVFGFGAGAACADEVAADTCQKTSAVAISDFQFTPSCITVAKGTEVTFTNRGTHGHTVATDADQVETIDSGNVAAQADFKHTFATAGTIKIHCAFHPQMHATIVVE